MTNETSLTNLTPRRFSLWPLLSGALFIGLGLLFLTQGIHLSSHNWWSIFIFIPALGFLWAAGTIAHFCGGTFNVGSRLHFSVGLILLTVALIFAFGLDWAYAWPLMLIVPGLTLFLNGFTWPRQRFGSRAGSAANFQFWLGTSVILLGSVFLLNQLGLIDLVERFGHSHWWWPFILLPGVGALVNAIAIRLVTGPSATGNALLALGLVLCVAAGAEYWALAWLWQVPLVLIVFGLTLLLAEIGRK